MNTNSSKAQAALHSAALFSLILILASHAFAQTPTVKTPAKSKATPTTNLEKEFFRNILRDQRAIWTSPFHLHNSDSRWVAPLGLTAVALLATDRHTSGELFENTGSRNRLRISKDISHIGSIYATGGAAAVFYLTGRVTNNSRARETGLLSAEALIDSNIVAGTLKLASQRQRPFVDHSSGEFFDGGSSFPSGHATNAWALATVIAQEYGHNHPLVRFGAYGLATAVSLSRYTGQNHFLSDVLVGSAMGYGIGRYVYRKHYDPTVDSLNGKQTKSSSLYPRIAPLYNPRARAYGAMLAWNF